MNFKTTKNYITKKAKELGACSDEYRKALKSENFDELIIIIRNNAHWTRENKLLDEKLSIKYFGFTLSNLFNSGDRNSGNRNSGDWNSGDRNSGYRNSGDRNSGYWNSGYRNSGNRNSGDWNSGDRNSGYRNSGNRNSGDWNSGDRNSGNFNTTTPQTINIFNKSCKMEDWQNANKPNFLFNININKWIYFDNMTTDEKKQHKKAFVSDGYLKTITYKEAWKIAYDSASKEDIKLLKNLPNWDSKVFEEITGIKVK